MTERLRKAADYIKAHPGCTAADIGKHIGVRANVADSVLIDLTTQCFLWSEKVKGAWRYYIDYEFDGSVSGTHDLWVAIFGRPLVMLKRDPSVLTRTALEQEAPWLDLDSWRIEPTGFGVKRADQALLRNQSS